MVQTTTNRPLSEVVREVRTKSEVRTSKLEPRVERGAAPVVGAPDLSIENVKHAAGATEIGKLSAEAVARDYEAAAKEIETMGSELLERVKQYETVGRDAHAVSAELNDIAARYRDEAKRVFDHIETCSIAVAQAHNICADLKDKMISPSIAG